MDVLRDSYYPEALRSLKGDDEEEVEKPRSEEASSVSLAQMPKPVPQPAKPAELVTFDIDSGRKIRTPWPNSDRAKCKGFKINFLKAKASPGFVPLASIPGSGSTMVRQLVESLTGIFTGDVFKVTFFFHFFTQRKSLMRPGQTGDQ